MQLPIVFMFSGQGSQYFGMAANLLRDHSGFRERLRALDETAGRRLGASVIARMTARGAHGTGSAEPFEDIRFTHPALFMVQYALAQTLIESGLRPDCVLGASLGETVAAAVSGALAPEAALEAVQIQAEAFAACPGGGMLAILDAPARFRDPGIGEECELAGINFANHFVVAGRRDGITQAAEHLRRQDVTFLDLPVRQGFHSSAIDDAAPVLEAASRSLPWKPAALPWISCTTAGRLHAVPGDHLWRAVRAPMGFRDAVAGLEAAGGAIYVDLGPSGTLATFVKYNLAKGSPSRHLAAMTQFGDDLRSLEALHTSLSARRATVPA